MEALTHPSAVLISHNNKGIGDAVPVYYAEAAAELPWQTAGYVKSAKILVLFIVSALILFFLSGSFALKQRPKASQKKVKQAVSSYYYP